MPANFTLIVSAAMLALAIVWFVIIFRALSNKATVESFFFGRKTPKDPL